MSTIFNRTPVFVCGIVLVIALVGIFFLGRITADNASVEHTTVVGYVETLPVFDEIAGLELHGDSIGEVHVEGAPLLFGLFNRDDTTMVYGYTWYAMLGSEPIIPRLDGYTIVLNTRDIDIKIIGEIAVFDFSEVITWRDGLFTQRAIPTEYTLELVDVAREGVRDWIMADERLFDMARDNIMINLALMYSALGFEVEWR